MSISTPEDLCTADATALLAGYARKDFTPVDVIDAVLARAEELNPKFNMFFHMEPEAARDAAKASAKRWSEGQPVGLLDGVPVTIKDSLAMKGAPMQVGARGYQRTISAADGPPAARMREAGAILFAKTTMPDYGALGSGLSTAHGVTRNPWNPAFNTGGSSSGTGAALAARVGPLGVGTDIGGSVRFPAALCGLTALKPSRGLIPNTPVTTVRSDPGPMARSARDLSLATRVLSGEDRRDFASVPGRAALAPAWRAPSELRIGLMLEMGFGYEAEEAVKDAVRKVADKLAGVGARIEVMRPFSIDPTEAMSALNDLHTLNRVSGMKAEELALCYPPLLKQAERVRGLSVLQHLAYIKEVDAARAHVAAATSEFDYVISPVAPKVNWPAEDMSSHEEVFDQLPFTIIFNHTGQPVACACAGFDTRGLPIGMQIIGRRFDDYGVIQLAHVIEQCRGFDIKWP